MFDGLDIKIMLFTAVMFLIILALLNSLLYKPLLGFIDSRNANIKADEDKIAKNKNEASNCENIIASIIADAKNEAQNAKLAKIEEAKELARQSIESKQADLLMRYEAHRTQLETNKDKLKIELRAQLSTLGACLDSSLKNI